MDWGGGGIWLVGFDLFVCFVFLNIIVFRLRSLFYVIGWSTTGFAPNLILSQKKKKKNPQQQQQSPNKPQLNNMGPYGLTLNSKD